MGRPAAQILPQYVCKASALRLDVIASLALTGALISVVFVVEMDQPARKCRAPSTVQGKGLSGCTFLAFIS